jgi:hypothetical protein
MRSDVLRRAAGGGTVPVTEGLDSLSEVAEQMPSVSNLNGAWRALADPVGIGAGAIAGDDLDAGTILQPGGDGGGLAIGQQIDHLVRLEVHDDGPVSTTSLPCPVIDAEDTRCHHQLSARSRRCQAQEGVGACRNRDPCSEARARFAAEREAKMVLEFSQSSGATAGTARDFRQALRERPALAPAIGTSEAACRDLNRHRPSLPREIVKQASIRAVNVS